MSRSRVFRILLAILIVFCLGVIGALVYARGLPAAPAPTPTAVIVEAETVSQVEADIQTAIAQESSDTPIFALNDIQLGRPTFSADQAWATAWINPLDPDTGQPLPIEPGLALAERVNGQWQVYLPSQPAWIDAVLRAPEDLVSEEMKAEWRTISLADADAQGAPRPNAPLHGYKLPYAGGETMRVTQSVGHDRYTPSGSAHFSFDFAKPGYPSGMFNIHAAKSGVVKRVRWTQPNGDEGSPGNYIVLEDTTTTPTTYMLYLHLAQDSIPADLRVLGTRVEQGQFLGIADDTGMSSGNHLHFMVHTTSTSYWGTSIDITFDDVSINGGRPRITSDKSYCKSSDVCDTFQTDYVSGNYFSADTKPPVGSLTSVQTGDSLTTPVVRLQGWALDEGSGLASVTILARLNGSWQTIAGPFNETLYTYDLDVCAAGVAPGPLEVALQIRDQANNTAPGLPGLVHLANNVVCPPPTPACTPTADQVALFTEKDYLGACTLLGAGNVNNLASLVEVGDNTLSSLLVGANVRATLYRDANLSGRAETFLASDSNLADNRLGKNSASSITVQARGAAPATPILIYPSDGAAFTMRDALKLSWNDGGGAAQFQARLLQGATTLQTSDWSEAISWNLGALPAGSYTWQVRGRTGSAESSWSAARSLVVQTAPAITSAPVDVPYNATFEGSAPGWTAANGWVSTNAINHTANGATAWQYTPGTGTYDTGNPNLGTLTSPPIRLPAGSAAYLSFWWLYETEGAAPWYDQRWVQISADGGPFTDLAQLSDDPANFWLKSVSYSLAAYAGKTVQVRFLFASLDAADNAHKGWVIDDFAISSQSPAACPADGDNTPAQANSLTSGASAIGAICPGDVDYYVFQAQAGQNIGAWIEAAVNGSPLDSMLTLYDSDGRSVIEKNDDQVQYERPDSWIAYRITRTGTYYVKVAAWDHPSAGSASHTYTLHLAQEAITPLGLFITPAGTAAAAPITLRVQAQDAGSGVAFVRFLWHSADWQGSDWVTLGEDWNGQDGWSYLLNPAGQSNLAGGAIYVKIYDWAGNQTGVGVWNLTSPNLFLPVVIKGR